jgi:GNAT superfamily N-acetyltransferase
MELRPAVAGDVPALAEGLAALPLLVRYGRDAARLARDLEVALARGDGLIIAAEASEASRTSETSSETSEAARAAGSARPLGLAWFTRHGTLGLGGYLRLMAVLPGAQARGVGAALLGAFEAEVAASSAHGFLLCSDFNEPAQRFYERHGWRRCGAVPGLVLPDVAELIYWKRLRPPPGG